MTNNLELAAEVFAIAAHEAIGQRRKYTGAPYYEHPQEVAQLVRGFGGTPDMIAAAYLHDVVEDTQVSLGTIRIIFGYEVADLVDWLTDVSKPEDGNRKARKAKDRAHIARAPAGAQTIKCCDLICNTSTIVSYDKNFAKVYLLEKKSLLEAMEKADPKALESAWQVLEEAQKVCFDHSEALK